MTSVAIAGLSKFYGTHLVLEDLDLEVPDGSLTAVLGPSGSGKTTLLRVLIGFERPEAGSVHLGSNLVASPEIHLAPEKRGIGYVPQDGALFPHLTVAGNVGFGLPRAARKGGRVDELLSMVGLQGKRGRYPHQLSGGEQQRVALARAMARAPGVVLLDEPFSSLDASLRAEVRADVTRVLKEAGTTAVLVTHDQDEALSLADRVAVLRDRRIAQCGSPEEIYTRPVDVAMARFIGEANLVPGTVTGDVVETALGNLPLLDAARAIPDARRVLVLMRPEQIEVSEAEGPAGLSGTVLSSQYYGHDAVTAVRPSSGDAGAVLHARLANHPPLPVGTTVTLRSSGPVMAWPAD